MVGIVLVPFTLWHVIVFYFSGGVGFHVFLLLLFLGCKFVRKICRLDPLLLTDEQFVFNISCKIKTLLSENGTPGMPNRTVWEALKAFLREEII